MPVINLEPSNDNKAVVLWRNWADVGGTSVTAGGSQSGNPIQNAIDPSTYNFWRAPNQTSAEVFFTFNTNRFVEAVGISAHDMASSGSSVRISSSDNGTDYTSRYFYTPTTNEDLLFLLPMGLSARYWRLGFTFTPAIGYISMGRILQFPSTAIDSYTPVHHSRTYTKYFNRSIQGQFLGNRVMGSGGNMSIQFPHVSRDWVDGPLIGFEDHYNRGGTFFYAGWPGGKPQDMAYGWAGGEDSIIDVEYVNADKLATVAFDMEFYNPT